MDNANIRAATGVSLAATFTNDVVAQFIAMRYLILLCIVLCVVDYRFGIKRARAQHEEIRRSKAWRRSVNKFFDYICWLLLAGVLALAFSAPIADVINYFLDGGIKQQLVAEIISTGTMCIACGCEIESIYRNWKIYRGLEGMKFWEIVKAFFISLAKHKDKDVGEAIEDAIDKNNEPNKEQA